MLSRAQATRAIAKGELVSGYGGKLTLASDFQPMHPTEGDDRPVPSHVIGIPLFKHIVIDARGAREQLPTYLMAGLMNSNQEDPNLLRQRRSGWGAGPRTHWPECHVFVACRDIAEGDELTWNYNVVHENEELPAGARMHPGRL